MNNRFKEWRKNNPEKRKEQKIREKTRRRLRDLSVLPETYETLTNEQKEIDEQIKNGTFVMPQKWTNINLKINQKLSKEELKKLEELFELKKTNEYILLKRAETNARERKLEFNLTLEDIIIPDKCPFFNVPFDDKRYSLSIDRIDSNKGYIKGNVQIISYIANKMKNDASIKELLIFANNVIGIYSNIENL
jgi:hypothetical protein